jgi:C1A family cysteine protease
MAELALGAIKKAILDSDARWEAQETSFAKMAKEERLLLLGYVPGPGDPSLEERESVAKSNLMAFEAMAVAEVGYPASYDLRNVAGQNFITSIKNQGGCGSCVAFGVAATVEGTFRRQRNNPGLAVDYSEAQLFYCYARSQGRNCSNGWWPNNALDFFRDSGVADESCYLYTAGDQNCTNLLEGHSQRVSPYIVTFFPTEEAFTNTLQVE